MSTAVLAASLSVGAARANADISDTPSSAAASDPVSNPVFPEPAGLHSAVSFWHRVYLEVTTDSGLLHDSRHLGVVYETVRFNGEKSSRARQKLIDSRRRAWRDALRRLARGTPPTDAWEKVVQQMLATELGHTPTARDLNSASRRIRFQLGQRDKFRAGIIRSGAYELAMRATFRAAGLPEDLAFLPHVESSFNPAAYSKYGAAGAWQFMRRTGRRYMTIDYVIDERLDPMMATRAAAKLLKKNYKSLQSWPLAITAYNHGRAGMARAKRKLGTDDLGVIAQKYRSRTFGFASRNFYAQFLAAQRILHAYEPYFGPLEREVPEAVDELELPFFAKVKDLQTFTGLAPEVIMHYNPALRPPIFRSGKRIPKGYVLRLPAGTLGPDADHWLAAIPPAKRYAAQHHSNYYRVRKGDTLSRIAQRHRTSVGTLVAINNLPGRHRIYPGQVLQLPDSQTKPKVARLAPKLELVRSAHASTLDSIPEDRIQPLTAPVPSVSADSPWRRVHSDEVIVDSLETLGHFADWLGIPTQRLRALNELSGNGSLRMGEKLKLDFSRVTPEQFLERRMEFHKGIEEDFFGSYLVAGTTEHTMRRGENLWELSHKIYAAPAWLIRRYNPTVDLTRLNPGVRLAIPVVRRHPAGS